MKTSELTGAALDWAVAKCEDPSWETNEFQLYREWHLENWKPSSDWSQGGPIIEQKRIGIEPIYQGYDVLHWSAVQELGEGRRAGPTPLIAAMRCYCCAKLGDEIDIPEGLCQQQNS